MKPTYSVIVPTRSNIGGLATCLQALLAKSPKQTEIIVVVNGEQDEDDGTVAYVRDLIGRAPLPIQVLDIRPIKGFSNAANAGLVMARGKYLCVLHDDTFVTRGWLDGLRSALRAAGGLMSDAAFGFVGPLTNSANTRQNLSEQVPQCADPAAAENVANGLRTADGVECQLTGALDSFCLMGTRDAFERVGLFDADTFGLAGYEDRDLILRAQRRGILSVMAPRVFVYHTGAVTVHRFVNAPHGQIPNYDAFLTKWRFAGSKHLGFLARVKADTDADLSFFIGQLEQARELGDWAIVLDDRSALDVMGAIKAAGLRDFVRDYRSNPSYEPASELRDRNTLIAMAQKQPGAADWLCWLEPYHRFAERVTRETFQELMNSADPAAKAYVCPVHTYWRGHDYLRVDGAYGERADQVLFKNEPWGSIQPWGLSTTVPSCLPKDNIPFTAKLVLEDYSYVNLERAKERGLEFNEQPHMLIPVRKPTFTHLLMVKNEEGEVARHIAEYRHWADDFVVVDTGSTDRTVAICEALGVKPIPYRCCDQAEDPKHDLCDYAAARNFCLDQCRTSYVLFLDADEGLAPTAFAMIPALLLENCDGYVCDILNFQRSERTGQRMTYPQIHCRLFRLRPEIRYESEIHETIEDSFARSKGALTLAKSEVTILHWGYERENPGERQWKAQRYAAHLMKLIEKDPKDARALYALGQHLNSQHQYDQGDALIGRALLLDANFFTARFDLSMRLMRRAYDLLGSCPPGSVPTEERRAQVERVMQTLTPWVAQL